MPTLLESDPALRKVAILIASLEPAGACALLEQLPPSDARRIEHIANTLTDIDPREREQVLAEFAAGDATREESGCEVDDSLTRRLAAEVDVAAVDRPDHDRERPRYLPWSALPATAIGQCLSVETPQVIAVVLTHLTPAQAAEVLATFSPAVQGEVLRRIVQAPRPAPEVLADIIEVIEARLPWSDRETSVAPPHAAAARAILDAAPAKQRQRWLGDMSPEPETSPRTDATDALSAGAPGAGARPSGVDSESRRDIASVPPHESTAKSAPPSGRPPVRELEQLLHGSDARLAKLFALANPMDVVLAFAAAAPDVVRRLHARLKPDESRALERQWTRLGPFRLTDAQHATQRLLDVATRLQDAIT